MGQNQTKPDSQNQSEEPVSQTQSKNWRVVQHPAEDRMIPKDAIPLGYENGKTYFLGKSDFLPLPDIIAWSEDENRWFNGFIGEMWSPAQVNFVCAPKQFIYVVKQKIAGTALADVIEIPYLAIAKVNVNGQDCYIFGRKFGDTCTYYTRSELHTTKEFYYICVWPNEHTGQQVDIGYGNRLADLGPDGITDVSNLNNEKNQAVWRNAVFCIAEAQFDCFPATESPLSIGMKHGSGKNEECTLQYTDDVCMEGVTFANLQIQNGERTVAWVLVQIGHKFAPDREEAIVGEQLRRALTDSLTKGHKLVLYHLTSLLQHSALSKLSAHLAAGPPQLTTSQATLVPTASTQTLRSTPSQAELTANYDDKRGVNLNQENCELELSKLLEEDDERLEEALKQQTRLNTCGDEVKATWGKLNVVVETRCSISSYNPQMTYDNFSKPKGLAIVFNNENFSNMERRLGTNIDAYNICMLLIKIGYEVRLKRDHSARDMLAAMARFAQKAEHKDCDSAVVVVLSHGGKGKIYGIDCMDETDGIPVKQFMGCLNANHCAGLIGKPKLFFIQACRGLFTDDGQHTYTSDHQRSATASIGGALANLSQRSITDAFSFLEQEDMNFADSGSKLPLNSDIFVAFSTTSGYVSWRSNKKGSWFIQAIVQVFQKNCAKEDIFSMMTEVVQIVTEVYETSSGEKQLPEFRSQLRKKFYFFPGLTSLPKP